RNVPSVIEPWMASQPPSASTPTMPSEGIAVSAGLYLAVSRIIRSRDANSFSLAASSRSCSCSSWPNPFTTRTPPMASSTTPPTQLAGPHLVLARAVQPGQRVEELGAQLVLHVEGDLAAPVAAQVDAAEVDCGRDEEQPGQRPDGRLVGHDHVVDNLPLHQGY